MIFNIIANTHFIENLRIPDCFCCFLHREMCMDILQSIILTLWCEIIIIARIVVVESEAAAARDEASSKITKRLLIAVSW